MADKFPDMKALAKPNLGTMQVDWDHSGKIPTDNAKWQVFPPGVKWSQEGYRHHCGGEGQEELSVVADVPWSMVDYFRQWVLGWSWVELGAIQLPPGTTTFAENNPPRAPNILHREPPLQCPKRGCLHLYASSAELLSAEGYVVNDPDVVSLKADGTVLLSDPEDPSTTYPNPWPAWCDRSSATGGNAKMRITFRPRNYVVRSDSQLASASITTELGRYIERSPQSAVQSLSLPAGQLIFNDAAADTKSPNLIPTPGCILLMPTTSVEYVWRQVPSPPFNLLESVVGHINANAFDAGNPLGYSFPAGTLLCLAPPRPRQYRMPTGMMAWDVHYTFLHRPAGWNFYPKGSGDFVQVVNVVTRKPAPYLTADFNSLFVPADPVAWD